VTIDSSILQSLPLFAALPADELSLLAERMRACRFDAGALVLREGDQCKEFYIVVRGEVDIIKALGTPDERLLAVRPAGTPVGELSLFSPGGRHTASVRAHGPLQMLVMTRADFDSVLVRQPRLAYNMVQTLSLRLIESEQTTIRDLHAKNESLAQALHALQAAQAQLVENEKLEHELQVARRIQSSLLPSERPACPGYDFGALMQPMSAVGGDFYDFVQFPDGRVGIAVGDVSDHGVPAALFMTMTVTLLRTHARRDASGSAAEPADVLRSVNRGLLEFNMSGMFVTVLYGVFDPRQREFSYARAGHEQPLLQLGPAAPAGGAAPAGPPRSPEESGMWIVDRSAWDTGAARPAAPSRRKGTGKIPTNPLEKTGAGDAGPLRGTENAAASATGPVSPTRPAPEPSAFSLHPAPHDFAKQNRDLPPLGFAGVRRGPSAFHRGQILGVVPDPDLDVQRLPVPTHSVLLLYTDGAREAWDAAGGMFGEQGLRAILAQAAQQPAQALCEQVFERLAAHRGPAPQQDDITLVAVKA
jgi:phosphoserine phosphatase RsbU/P